MDVPLPVHNEHYMNYILNLIDEFAPGESSPNFCIWSGSDRVFG